MMPQDSEEAKSREPEPQAAPREGLEPVEEKNKAAEYLSNWQRTQADFINYKRRNEQERQEFNKFANANLILSLLPVLDDLELALDSVPPGKSTKHSWVEGVSLVDRKFRTILEAQGVAPIKALGEPFDPNFHEAVRQDRGPEGIVIQELQKGYMMHDKLLRPARVVVGNGGEEEKKEDI